MTLVEFVEARIADDEAAELRHLPADLSPEVAATWRVLRECEAYRALVEFARDEPTRWYFILAPFARIWRDHPDYNPDWGVRTTHPGSHW